MSRPSARSAEPAPVSVATSAGDALRRAEALRRATSDALGPLTSPERPLPPDPWLPPRTPAQWARDGQAPRLCAFVSSRQTHYGLVVDLTAALWGGH